MRSTWVIASLFVGSLLVGCTANKEIEKYADRACECKDKDCATKVANEFASWLKDNKNARGDEDKAAKDGERMFKCLSDKGADMSKLMEAAAEVSK
jgi:hypothetical protein